MSKPDLSKPDLSEYPLPVERRRYPLPGDPDSFHLMLNPLRRSRDYTSIARPTVFLLETLGRTELQHERRRLCGTLKEHAAKEQE